MRAQESKIVLVTGANKGIGFEIARQLGAEGFTILLGARSPELGNAAAATLREQKVDARFVALDLERDDTIASAAAHIASEFGRLDVLVNNAGISDAHDGAPSTASLDSVERSLQVNFLGTLAVTQAMLPLIRKSVAGRIVNLSSGLGSLTLHSDPTWEYAPFKLIGYCASKAALNMLTVQLAWELRDTAIKVNSADPGYTATDMNQNRGHQTIAEGAAEAVRLALLPADGATGGFFNSAGPEPW